MNTNGLVKFIAVAIVLLLVISIGVYFLLKPPTTPPPNEADINAIYQVVGEFGARLKDVNVTVPKQEIITAVDFNLKRLITDGLYQEFVQDTSKVPGRTVSSPWPERVEIVSVQKEDDTSYTVNGKIIGMASVEMTQGGNAGETSITFTLKKVKGTWLIDEVK